MLYQGKNVRQKVIAAAMSRKRPGKPGWYFRVLNCASENGLSSDTWGRLSERVTPRSASSCAVHLLVIGAPRSEWQCEHPGLDVLFVAGLFDETTGQRRVLPVGHHPADRVAAEDVEHDVEIEVRPLRRPQQLGDVPGPGLVRRRGHQLGFAVLGMLTLIAPLPDRPIRGQDSIHRPLRAQVVAFVEQRRHDFRRRAVHEAWAGEHIEDLLALGFT